MARQPPTLAYRWGLPWDAGVSVQAGGLGQEGESSTMVPLVTENRELV